LVSQETVLYLHLQSEAGISCHSTLSQDRFRQCGTSSGSRHKDTDHCLYIAISFYGHRSPQCHYSMRKWFTRDHCY